MDGEGLLVEDADFNKFLVGFVDLGEERAAGHRDDCVAWELPAELLGDFEAHAFGSLRVVGAEVHIHKAPAVFAGDLGAEAVHLIVGAFDADDLCAVNKRADNFALLQIRGDEDIARETCSGCIGGHGVREVAGGGAGDDFEAQLAGAAESNGDNAVFKGKGGVVDRVVLDVKFLHPKFLCEAVSPNERGETNLRSDGGLAIDWQQLAVAPHRLRTRGDDLAVDVLGNEVVVVSGFKGAKIKLADVDCLFWIKTPALPAFQVRKECLLFAHVRIFHSSTRVDE